MKKSLLALPLALLLFAAGAVYAQEAGGASGQSEYYYVNVPVEKVYPHRKGFVVTYRATGNRFERAYLPVEWFSPVTKAGHDQKNSSVDARGEEISKGELITMGPGLAWPYMTVYYRDGAFSHVRLYLRRERGHETWGYLSPSLNIDDKFEVETLDLAF